MIILSDSPSTKITECVRMYADYFLFVNSSLTGTGSHKRWICLWHGMHECLWNIRMVSIWSEWDAKKKWDKYKNKNNSNRCHSHDDWGYNKTLGGRQQMLSKVCSNGGPFLYLLWSLKQRHVCWFCFCLFVSMSCSLALKQAYRVVCSITFRVLPLLMWI